MSALLSVPKQSSIKLKAIQRPMRVLKVNPWLRQLEQIASEKLGNSDLKVGDLGRSLFMSERQFFRRVKQLSGKTPNQYLQELRLKRAYQLIHSGQFETVKSVSIQVGFKKAHYFSCLFEKRFGFRPNELLIN